MSSVATPLPGSSGTTPPQGSADAPGDGAVGAEHQPRPVPGTTGPVTLSGIPVVPGAALGPAVRPAPRPVLPAADAALPADSPGGAPAEASRFEAAAEVVAAQLEQRAAAASSKAASEVLLATAGLARDRGLRKAVAKNVAAGRTAPAAVVGATEQFSAMFTKLGGLMAERVTDLHDLRDRIVATLTGQAEPGVPVPAAPSVLLADDLAPADTATLDPSLVVGLATRLGGPTSHTAIIARQLGIPCVVAVEGLADVPAGHLVLVDGDAGQVVVDPDAADAQARVDAARAARDAVASWSGPGATSDGHVVNVLANVQDGAGARAAAATSAEGIGLFRTELAFLDAETEPTVAEQAEVYTAVLEAFAQRPWKKLVVRTLDAGSDKPLKFAGSPDEENPALGVRGLRIAFGDPGLLERQLDALALAAERTGITGEGSDGKGGLWVMAPMVATTADARFFADRARERGLVPGAMVEIPAAALHADRLLRIVDFLSIGTNDLAQYTMAADRLSSDLAALNDPWQPALLELVRLTAAAGVAAGKPVGVCGEAAADPLLACVLVGLGITSLSCAAASVAGVGAQLATASLEACTAAARAATAADDPASARAAARAALAG